MPLDFWRTQPWNIETISPPWSDEPSIHRFLHEHLRSATGSLSRAGVQLPDEDRVLRRSGAGVRWVAGGLDGAFGHHISGSDAEEVARRIVAATRALSEKASNDRAAALYTLLMDYPALQFTDALLPLIVETTHLDRVQRVARWLAKKAPDREPVKAAIAILGVVSRGEDRELLLTLGRHEEFTLFSAVALSNSEEAPDALLWDLAQHVTGWGRIHIVERLVDTRDARIKAWLLREGCRNDIMDEYTALICAQVGDLVTALQGSDPDPALIRGAGAILSALIRGGPAEGMEGYADGPEAVDLYLRQLRRREADLEDLNVVATIGRFVTNPDGTDGARSEQWRARAVVLEEHIAAIKARPDWPAKVHAGLADLDRTVFSTAAEAATLFSIDTWEVYYDRLLRGEDQWFFVMQTNDPSRIDRVVSLAEQRLPLQEIATGPSNELGLGPAFQAHAALDWVLQDLRRFPGKGWSLIRTGLQSPVTRNRNMAVTALAAWGRTSWPADAELTLRRALKAEPNDQTGQMMRKALDQEPL